MITGLSHVSIAVPSLEAAAKRLQDLYGLAAGEPMINEQQGIRLAYVDLGNARIELMEPARPDSSISKFLEHHPGGGIHHFCLNVDEMVATAAAIAGKGAGCWAKPAKPATFTASSSLSCIRKIFSGRWWSWKSTRSDP